MALPKPHIITPDSALGGTEIQRSVKFHAADTTYLKRTVTSEGNRVKWTWSAWVKRTKLGTKSQGTQYALLTSPNGGDGGGNNGIASIYWGSDDKIHCYYDTTGTNNSGAINDNIYRDVSSWYHIVWNVDASNSTARIWVNGVEQSIASGAQPVSGYNYTMNQNGYQMTMGIDAWDLYSPAGGYMAETHFSDGQLYQATDFGYTDAQTGQWRPKNGNVIKSNITYGTNGYWLDFRDNTNTTTLGYDYSGNGNHWTCHNMSATSGTGNDSTEDSPTNNWCTWNTPTEVSDIVLTDGNLKAVSGADSWPAIFGTHGASSGKWYYEAVGADNTRWGLGWSTEEFKSGTSGTFSVGHFAYSQDPLTLYQDGSNVAINGTPAFTTGNTLQIAIDIDNGKTWFGINNTWVNASNGSAGDPAAGTNPTITFSEKGQKHYPKMINNLGNVNVNFGQQGFTYTPPDGFQALNSKNLATVNAAGVVRPQRFFANLLYSGNASTNKITGLEFKPDFVWTKVRNATGQHSLFDSVRGATKRLGNGGSGIGNQAETTVAASLQSFDETGFTFGNEAGNNNGENYIAWCWKAGGTAVTNTVGNISAQVSANDEAGFSIITYTGDGNTSGNVGTGLRSTQPLDWAIVKRRDDTSDWQVGHRASGQSSNFAYHTNLNDTSALSGSAPYHMGTQSYTNGDRLYLAEGGLTSSATYVAYVWQERPGYSKFGSYTGNGSSDGAFVHCGFRPAWVVIKKTSGTSNWNQRDTARDPDNPTGDYLLFNSNEAEGTSSSKWDILSNGFKHYNTSAAFNESGATYIFIAFAERPSGTMFGLDANAR